MKWFVAHVLPCLVAVATVTVAPLQAQPAASRSDVYHVHFTKAVPGQADALGKALMAPDSTAPMPEHFIVLRHQEGDDWDYCVIQHLGPKATVDPTPTPPDPSRDMRAWHDDTFVSGPSWADFTSAMGIGGSATGGAMMYAVGVHRAVPGHRDQLEKALMPAPSSSKVQTGNVLLQHLEGANWNYVAITRYNSWQDLATDRAQPPAGPGGWGEIRQHSAFHRDTIADRIAPK
jgi:hypothetical protein